MTTDYDSLEESLTHVEPLNNPLIQAVSSTDSKLNFLSLTPQNSLREQMARHTKLAQSHVSRSLFYSSRPSQAKASYAMSMCGKYATHTGQYIRPLNRCHRRSCPVCSSIKGAQITRRAMRALDQLRFSLVDEADEQLPAHRRMIAIKVTLNSGEACTFDHLKLRIACLHKIWARMLRTRDISEHLIGSLDQRRSRRRQRIKRTHTSMAYCF